jgi:hypothetical protein
MIVEPGFLDHWKTRMLCDTLADPCAPLYVLRIWEHCQMRRKWVFDVLPSAALKALCRYNGHANQLESALVASGFVRRDEDGSLTALKWDEYNASLVANWDNGAKGGRPPKRGKITQSKPTENPSETHGLPMANPPGTEKRREEKMREEVSLSTPAPPNADPPHATEPHPDAPIGPGFRRWWSEYPRHRRGSLSEAMRAWQDLYLEPKTEAVMASLNAWKESSQWREGLINRADKWLKEGIWENAPESSNGHRDQNQGNRRPSPEDARRAADRANRVGGGQVGPIPILGKRTAG